MSGKKLGLILSSFVILLSSYEFFAIAIGPLPTWSRMVQGLRDSSTIGFSVVVGLSSVIGIALIVSAVWVVNHFTREHRSTL
jgi:hypothetical protein